MSDEAYADLAARIDAIVDELDQVAFDDLRAASAEGRARPARDKRAMRARRSLEKAAGLLRGTDESTDDVRGDD